MGNVGQVRSVNREVERRAGVALATADAVESAVADDGVRVPGDPPVAVPHRPAAWTGRPPPTTRSRSGPGPRRPDRLRARRRADGRAEPRRRRGPRRLAAGRGTGRPRRGRPPGSRRRPRRPNGAARRPAPGGARRLGRARPRVPPPAGPERLRRAPPGRGRHLRGEPPGRPRRCAPRAVCGARRRTFRVRERRRPCSRRGPGGLPRPGARRAGTAVGGPPRPPGPARRRSPRRRSGVALAPPSGDGRPAVRADVQPLSPAVGRRRSGVPDARVHRAPRDRRLATGPPTRSTERQRLPVPLRGRRGQRRRRPQPATRRPLDRGAERPRRGTHRGEPDGHHPPCDTRTGRDALGATGPGRRPWRTRPPWSRPVGGRQAAGSRRRARPLADPCRTGARADERVGRPRDRRGGGPAVSRDRRDSRRSHPTGRRVADDARTSASARPAETAPCRTGDERHPGGGDRGAQRGRLAGSRSRQRRDRARLGATLGAVPSGLPVAPFPATGTRR